MTYFLYIIYKKINCENFSILFYGIRFLLHEMGKKQKIRSGAGDVIGIPGPLDKQIEKAKVAKVKVKFQKHVNSKENDELEEEVYFINSIVFKFIL